MHKPNWFLFLALIWTSLITWLSLVTIGSIGGRIPIPHKDKGVHFIFYLVFVVLWVKSRLKINRPILYTVFLIAIGYGVSMEILQYAITNNRSADGWDVFANTLGALTGLLLMKNKLEKAAH